MSDPLTRDPITEAGFRIVAAHKVRDEILAKAQRFAQALADDPDPTRREVAVELTEIIGAST